MSSITITTNVTLDTTKNALDVHDHHAPIPVPAESHPTNLVWQLSGNAAQGSFNAIDAPTNKGFSWIDADTPPSDAFGTPTLAANSKQITMTDTNSGTSPPATWHYQLCATIDGVVYCTTASVSTSETTDNPAIKNN